MQPTTGTFDAAEQADAAEPLVRVTLDADGDGSYETVLHADDQGGVESVSVDRSLSTDLPEQVQAVTGIGGAAELSITLADAPDGTPGGTWLSPFSGALTSRVGLPVKVELGWRGGAGPEYVSSFVGSLRQADADAAEGVGSFTALDWRERIAGAVDLPVLVADDLSKDIVASKRPGLNAQWMLDWLLRQSGFCASPPVRAQCLLSATLHGSVWPEVGTLTGGFTREASTNVASGALHYREASDGSGLLALTNAADDGFSTIVYALWALTNPLTPSNGTTLLIEFDHLDWNPPGTANPGVTLCSLGDTKVGQTWVGVDVVLSGGSYQTRVSVMNNGGTLLQSNLAATAPDGGYFAVALTWGASNVTGVIRNNGAEFPVTVAGAASGGQPIDKAWISTGTTDTITGAVIIEWAGFQVTTEAYTPTVWNDGFAPTARLEPCLNELVGTPVLSGVDRWEAVSGLVEAELGVLFLDESGAVVFYNRQHMQQAAPVATLTADQSLLGLSSSEQIDSVRNAVAVPASPVRLAPEQWVWTLAETVKVPGRGQVVLAADLEGNAYAVDTSVGVFPSPNSAWAGFGSGYRASTRLDGTGTAISNLTVTVAVYQARLEVTVRNPNSQPVWLVNNTNADTVDEQGEPCLQIRGRLLLDAAGGDNQGSYLASASSATSVAAYGEQALDVDSNPWRQTLAAAQDLAGWLLGMLAVPRPVFADVPVTARLGVQLADKVTVVEPDVLQVATDAWVTGIRNEAGDDGISQTLTLRAAPMLFLFDDPVRGRLDYNAVS